MIGNREADERGRRKKVNLNCECHYFDMVISSPSFADIVIEPEGILAAFGGFKYVQFHANLEIQPCSSPIY